MKKPRIHITEHAVYRYLERVKGIDMDAVRAEIAAKIAVAEAFGTLEPTGVIVDGCVYRLSGKTLVTVFHQHHERDR